MLRLNLKFFNYKFRRKENDWSISLYLKCKQYLSTFTLLQFYLESLRRMNDKFLNQPFQSLCVGDPENLLELYP